MHESYTRIIFWVTLHMSVLSLAFQTDIVSISNIYHYLPLIAAQIYEEIQT